MDAKPRPRCVSNDERVHNHSLAARHTAFSPLLFTKTPRRDEDILEQKRVLPESMTDASRGFHGPLTQKGDDRNHSGVTAEDEILPGRKRSVNYAFRDSRSAVKGACVMVASRPDSGFSSSPATSAVSRHCASPKISWRRKVSRPHRMKPPPTPPHPTASSLHTVTAARPLPDVTVRGSERPTVRQRSQLGCGSASACAGEDK